MNGLVALAAAVVGLAVGPVLAKASGRIGARTADVGRIVRVTVVTTLIFTALATRLVGDPQTRYALPAFLVLAGAGVVLAVVDLDTSRLPDAITIPAYPVLAGLLVTASVAAGDVSTLVRSGIGAAMCLTLYAGLCLAPGEGLGFGDVKLAGLLGMALGWLSWSSLVTGVVLGFGYGAMMGLVLLATGRATIHSRMPFGPAMLAGAFTGVLVGERLSAAYLAWALP